MTPKQLSALTKARSLHERYTKADEAAKALAEERNTEIKRLMATGDYTQSAIAAAIGISSERVSVLCGPARKKSTSSGTGGAKRAKKARRHTGAGSTPRSRGARQPAG